MHAQCAAPRGKATSSRASSWGSPGRGVPFPRAPRALRAPPSPGSVVLRPLDSYCVAAPPCSPNLPTVFRHAGRCQLGPTDVHRCRVCVPVPCAPRSPRTHSQPIPNPRPAGPPHRLNTPKSARIHWNATDFGAWGPAYPQARIGDTPTQPVPFAAVPRRLPTPPTPRRTGVAYGCAGRAPAAARHAAQHMSSQTSQNSFVFYGSRQFPQLPPHRATLPLAPKQCAPRRECVQAVRRPFRVPKRTQNAQKQVFLWLSATREGFVEGYLQYVLMATRTSRTRRSTHRCRSGDPSSSTRWRSP